MTNRWGAAHLLLAATALVAGLVIGGLGPRSEARSLREQLEAAEDQECEGSSGMGREIAQVFRGRPLGDNLPVPRAEEDPGPAADEPGAADEGEDEGDGRRRGGFRGRWRRGEGPGGAAEESPEEAMRLAREAMDLRRTQARAALAEAGASEEQLSSIDAAMGRMNADLAALTETFVATAQEGEPDRREMMMFAADTLDVLLEGEDALYGVLDEEQRADLDDAALDPFSYIDGSVVDELMKLEGL